MWRDRFGGDPSIVGASFLLEGAPYTVVGVAPPGFFGGRRPSRSSRFLDAARRGAGVPRTQLAARSEIAALAVRLRPRSSRGVARAPIEAKLRLTLQSWLLANEPPRDEKGRLEIEKQQVALAPAAAASRK